MFYLSKILLKETVLKSSEELRLLKLSSRIWNHGGLKMTTFCQHSYHRKCQHRWVGGQKEPTSCQCSLWTTPYMLQFQFCARGCSQICWQDFGFVWPPTSIDIFYGMKVDKKWRVLNHLSTSSCKRSLWTAPYPM